VYSLLDFNVIQYCSSSHCFGGMYHHNLQCKRVRQIKNPAQSRQQASFLLGSPFNLEDGGNALNHTILGFYCTTSCHNPEHYTIHCENHKSTLEKMSESRISEELNEKPLYSQLRSVHCPICNKCLHIGRCTDRN
jgi:hypothetical protein